MAQSVRFVWQTDEQGRFTLASEEFMRLVGDQTAALLGQPWAEIAERLGLDPDRQIAQALSTRDTWSAITVSWPTEKKEHALAVELSGLPVFDRERTFRGYRGFGICRDAPPIAAALLEPVAPAVPAFVTSERAVAAGAQVMQKNVVRLRGNEARDAGAPSLSRAEHEAFREISRKLGRRLNRRSGDQRSTAAPAQDEPERDAALENPAPSAIEEKPAERASDIRILLDRLPAGILVYRVTQLLYANPSFLRWSGHPSLERLIEAGGLDELFVEPLAAADDADIERGLTVNLTGRDNRSLACELLRIVWKGEAAHALLANVVQDTKQADSVRESDRADDAYSPKSAFIAHVSHELRTPLNSIIGFAELMIEERIGPLGNARYREYLKDIHDSGTHLLSLVNDLLDLSRLEAGKFALAPAPLDLNEIVGHCVALMQPQAQRARVVMRSAPAAALPPVVADMRSVRQVLFNLLANSLKFTPAGGQVIVSTSLHEQREAVLRVRDTGKGMRADQIHATMEAGQRWDGLPGRNGGLGLLLTKALAEANGATFRLASTLGSGTLVEIAFPTGALPG
jgi:signal transduction histidine kinase